MKVCVLIRSVIDSRVPLPPDASGERPIRESMKRMINPGDWQALQQIRSLAPAASIHLIALGPPSLDEDLSWSLAEGAKSATRIWDPSFTGADLQGKARALAALLKELSPELVLAGETSLDQVEGGLAGALAAEAELVFLSGISCLERVARDRVTVIRRYERGKRQRLEVKTPVFLALDDSTAPPPLSEANLASLLPHLRRGVEARGLRSLGLREEQVGSRAAGTARIRIRFPEPVITRPKTPALSLSAEERLRSLIDTGIERQEGEVLTGEPEEMVTRLVDYLIKK